MVLETNNYATKITNDTDLKAKSRMKAWTPTNSEEMYAFYGILLIMGMVRLPHINDYWSKKKMYRNELVASTMQRDRFLLLLRCWHFSSVPNDGTDKLYKIRDLYEMIIEQFNTILQPGKIIVIDESMIPWRGRLKFRQYIKNKSHKYGVKLYKLCTPEGYTYHVNIYTGKGDNGRELNHGKKTVERLMSGLENKGRILITDNFYNSIELAEELIKKNTYICGTLRSNRKNLPKIIVSKKLKKGQIIGKMNRKGVRVIKWMDKRPVLMISTCKNHTAELKTIHKVRNGIAHEIKKPECVLTYNRNKKGIDFSDQMSAYYTTLKRGLKWYRKVIMELLFGTAITNAWIVHNTVKCTKMSKKNFVESIIEAFTRQNSSNIDPVPPIELQHKFEMTDKKRKCTSCYEKLRESMSSRLADNKVKKIKSFCRKCNKALCLDCYNLKH